MLEFLRATTLILVLLNPFLVVLYLLDVIQKREMKSFTKALAKAGFISILIFWIFALLGDSVFSELMQAQFESFQIFGGLVFLLIGLNFVFKGSDSIELLRGDSEHLAGAIAMPALIGPGTISASVVVGNRLEPLSACMAILVAVTLSLLVMIGLKKVHDYVRPRNEQLVQRYIEVMGRITAFYVGTIAVDMMMRGFSGWIEKI
ncbi:MAG: MarC family protein [Candidatus Omnitrophica bacterium]|nr:MarC family protein [Candidatus Omnitrophota bacterium]